jgi:hypothetical protein
MSKDVPEVPPEVKHQIAVNSLWSIIVSIWASTIDSFAGVSYAIPFEKWLTNMRPHTQALATPGVKSIIENFKIPGNDCTTVAKVHQIMVDAMGFDPEIIEMTPEKAIVHERKCPTVDACKLMLPKYLDAPIDKMACSVFDETIGTAINPNITFRKGETICQGGKICEHIWELKK